MNKVLQNRESFYFKVTKNKSITATKLISLMKGNKLNNQQKLKCALVWFVHAMLLAKDPLKKMDSDHIKMVTDLEFFGGYPWGKESFELTLSYLEKKTDLTKQKKAFFKRNNISYALFGFPWAFLVWIYEAFPHLGRYAGNSLDSPLPIPHLLRWHTSKCDNIMEGDSFKYKENNTKIVHPYLTPTVREIEQRHMKTFKTYTEEVKDTSIYALKAQLKGVTVQTSSAEVTDEDEDLDGHHYVLSPPRACDHAGSSGLKTSPDVSNDDDLHERVALLEKSLLDIASLIRDERLRRIEKNKKKQQEEVAVTDMATTDKKGEEEKKEEEEMEENNAADEEEEEEEEEEKRRRWGDDSRSRRRK
ncbi:hypothetical protein FXO37_08115 [Capsicum annuum]|nr:hypothetical protein FXO37_08115 [Capsicum annuum]